jgi:hypothetical protein
LNLLRWGEQGYKPAATVLQREKLTCYSYLPVIKSIVGEKDLPSLQRKGILTKSRRRNKANSLRPPKSFSLFKVGYVKESAIYLLICGMKITTGYFYQ